MVLGAKYPIRTARLSLRPLTEADVNGLAAYRSLPEVFAYVPGEATNAEGIRAGFAERFGRGDVEHAGQHLLLGVELADTGELIGDVVLQWLSEEHRSGEIGYIFHPGHGGRGYATEAVHRVLHLAFDDLGLHRVMARVDLRNVPSARLLRRLGFRQEAHLRENEWFKGVWSDELDFGMLEDEWRAQHADGCPDLSARVVPTAVVVEELAESGLRDEEVEIYDRPVGVRLLSRDPVSGAEHYLVRYPPSLVARRHRHSAAHTFVVLEGELEVNGRRVGPGSYCHFPAGTAMHHGPAGIGGCLFVAIFDGPQDVESLEAGAQ